MIYLILSDDKLISKEENGIGEYSNCPIECPSCEKANTSSTYVFNTYVGDRDDTALVNLLSY